MGPAEEELRSELPNAIECIMNENKVKERGTQAVVKEKKLQAIGHCRDDFWADESSNFSPA